MCNVKENMVICRDYTEFVETIIQMVSKQMGERFRVTKYQTGKNNGTFRCGVMIVVLDKQTEYVSCEPIIYLEEYYDYYKEGMELSEIARLVIHIYYECTQPFQFTREDFLFENMKGRICFMLVNRDLNQSALLTRPHRPFLDLAVIYYILLFQEEDGIATIPINNALMDKWGVDENILWQLAYDNTKRIQTPSLQSMQQVLCELTGRYWGASPTLVLSNTSRTYGAASILYKEGLQCLADIIESSYYIFPSSIHECILYVDRGEADKTMLDEMVRDINQTQVSAEEVLADHIYYYDWEKKELQY